MRESIKRISLLMMKHYFSEADSSMILIFLSHFVKEANFQEICESEAFVALPSILEELAKTEFESGVEVSTQRGRDGSALWPETV